MANFITTFQKGQQGLNKGFSMGIPPLDKILGGVEREVVYAVGAGSKVGKTTWVDFSFVLMPYLDAIKTDRLDDIEWVYFSYEINRIKKEFKYATFFMFHDYGIDSFVHNNKLYPISPRYLMGKLLDSDREVIKVMPQHIEKLKEVYKNRIIPLFGEYDSAGKKIKNGKITFFEQRDNPTGMHNFLKGKAAKEGVFQHEEYSTLEDGVPVIKKKIIGYTPNNPKKVTIVITDHIRKLKHERGFTLKQNMDKWIEYSVEGRNLFSYTYVHIGHINRGIDTERLKFMKDSIYPTVDDFKDSGNVGEEADFVFSMFNPNDDKYNLTKHFGLPLLNADKSLKYPNLRTIHLIESRDTEQCPLHIRTTMRGNINHFSSLQT